MPVPTTLPILAGLSIFGAALGVTLGKSAISEINPAYFNEAEDQFHADLVPYRSQDWGQVHQAEYREAQQPVVVGELGGGCIGCRDYPVEYVPRHDPAVDSYSYSEVTYSAPQAVQAAMVEAPAADPAREQVERYASYAVTSDERPAQIAEAQDAATAEASPTGL